MSPCKDVTTKALVLVRGSIERAVMEIQQLHVDPSPKTTSSTRHPPIEQMMKKCGILKDDNCIVNTMIKKYFTSK